jgi:hypothetical protein
VVWKAAEVERGGKRGTLKWGSEEMPFDGMKGLGEDAKGSGEVGRAPVKEESTRARPRGAEEPGVRRKGGRHPAGQRRRSKCAGFRSWLAVGVVGVKLKSPHPDDGGRMGTDGLGLRTCATLFATYINWI